MVRVKVVLPSVLRQFTGGNRQVDVEASTVREALERLVELHGEELRRRLLEADGSVRRLLNVFVNGKNVRFLHGLDTVLEEGDEVSILPAVGGGCKCRWG